MCVCVCVCVCVVVVVVVVGDGGGGGVGGITLAVLFLLSLAPGLCKKKGGEEGEELSKRVQRVGQNTPIH